jgi:hypothetical protein
MARLKLIIVMAGAGLLALLTRSRRRDRAVSQRRCWGFRPFWQGLTHRPTARQVLAEIVGALGDTERRSVRLERSAIGEQAGVHGLPISSSRRSGSCPRTAGWEVTEAVSRDGKHDDFGVSHDLIRVSRTGAGGDHADG